MEVSPVHCIQNPTLPLHSLSNIYRAPVYLIIFTKAPVVCAVPYKKDTGQGGEWGWNSSPALFTNRKHESDYTCKCVHVIWEKKRAPFYNSHKVQVGISLVNKL